jgi:hypothetical protein
MANYIRFLRGHWPIVIAASICFTLFLLLYADEMSVHLFVPDGERVWIWPNKYLSIISLIFSLVFPLLGVILLKDSYGNGTSLNDSLRKVCLPIVFLPLTMFVVFLWPFVSFPFFANFLLLIPALIFSLVLYRAFSMRWNSKVFSELNTLVLVTIVIIVMSAFYWGIGYYFTTISGAHGGDEGHYIIQSESLYYDHDLDIYNNFDTHEKAILESHGKGYLHISENSRGNHLYSWHPFGISFLMAFAVPGGVVFRHLILGIVAGISCGGMILLGHLVGAEKRSNLMFCGLFWVSTLWGIYASRALPETAGAMLTIFLTASVLGVKKYPRLSLFGAMLCCLGLPWLHVRFIPISAIGACFFLYNAYRFHEKIFWRRILPVFSMGVFVVGGVFIAVNYFMFESATGYSSTGLFDYPLGMLTYIGGYKGLVSVLPIFACALWVVGWTIFFDRDNQLAAIMTFLILVAVLATSCSSQSFSDGASMRGRMLLVCVPLFIPLMARFFDKSSVVNRWFFLFLSIIPVLTFAMLLFSLPVIKKDFAMPYDVLPVVIPLLRGLSNPFTTHGELFAIFLYLVSFLLIFTHQKKERIHLFLIGLLFVVTCSFAIAEPVREKLSEGEKKANSRIFSGVNLAKVKIWSSTKSFPEKSVYEFFANGLEVYDSENTPIISSPGFHKEKNDRIVVPDSLEPNDWNGRDYKWVTLAKPFTVSKSSAVFCVSASKEGNTQVSYSLVELSSSGFNSLIETEVSFDAQGKMQKCYTLQTSGKGKVHILARLYGEKGSLRINALHWLPVNPHLLKEFNLIVPYEL